MVSEQETTLQLVVVDRDTSSNNVRDIMSFDNYYIDQSEIMSKDITIIKGEKASLSGCQRQKNLERYSIGEELAGLL